MSDGSGCVVFVLILILLALWGIGETLDDIGNTLNAAAKVTANA